MTPELQRDLMAALERSSRLGTIGGDLEEQLAHSAGFSSVLGQLSPGIGGLERGVDLGTGGGLPGVVLAALWPAMAWTLIDMRTARADEVERTILRLGLSDRVTVRGMEAQRVGRDPLTRESFDVAVARAFGHPSLTAECAAGLLRVGGCLIVSEPPDLTAPERERRWDGPGLTALGFGEVQDTTVDDRRFVVIEKLAPTSETFPRLPPRPNRGWPGG